MAVKYTYKNISLTMETRKKILQLLVDNETANAVMDDDDNIQAVVFSPEEQKAITICYALNIFHS